LFAVPVANAAGLAVDALYAHCTAVFLMLLLPLVDCYIFN